MCTWSSTSLVFLDYPALLRVSVHQSDPFCLVPPQLPLVFFDFMFVYLCLVWLFFSSRVILCMWLLVPLHMLLHVSLSSPVLVPVLLALCICPRFGLFLFNPLFLFCVVHFEGLFSF